MSSPPSTTKYILTPEDIVWTPHNMTPAQALDQLPFVCQLLLKDPPSQCTLERLRYYHADYVKTNKPEFALLVARCIVKAEQVLAERAE